MGCIWLALEALGVNVRRRYVSEVDKFANAVNDKNYPDTIHLGDVRRVRAAELERIDLFVGGSPCQGFSFAGKQLNFDDPRSSLFFEFVRLWQEIKAINPDAKFLLENVKMKKEYQNVISAALGVQPVEINSALVSAQNRRRLYWTNLEDVTQPEDKGIPLKHILQPESEVDEKYYLNKPLFTVKDSLHRTDVSIDPYKAHCLKANEGRQRGSFIKVSKKGKVKRNQDKAACLTGGGHSGGNHSDMDVLCVAMRGCNPENPSDRTAGAKTEQRLEPKKDGKTNCLTSVSKDNLIFIGGLNENVQGTGRLSRDYRQGDRAYSCEGKATTISASGGGLAGKTGVYETLSYRLRRLTPIECERLQTVPDNYTDCVSDTQRYKMLGNGWTVDVIAHILKGLKTEQEPHLTLDFS